MQPNRFLRMYGYENLHPHRKDNQAIVPQFSCPVPACAGPSTIPGRLEHFAECCLSKGVVQIRCRVAFCQAFGFPPRIVRPKRTLYAEYLAEDLLDPSHRQFV